MQRADLAWRGISAPSCASSLALVLRGQGFRIGGHRSRTHTSQLEEQLRAVTSVHDHVVVPAERNGWSLSLALHVFAPPRHVDALLAHLAVLQMSPAAIRNQTAPDEPTQLASWATSLQWAGRMGPARWSAMLILRLDLAFKQHLPLPRPCGIGHRILATFQQSFAFGSHNNQGQPRIADVLLFVPRVRHAELLAALKGLGSTKEVLHDLCNWVDDVGFMFSPGHDANSEKEWNPLYRITGRREAAPGVINASSLPRRGRYPRSSREPSLGCHTRHSRAQPRASQAIAQAIAQPRASRITGATHPKPTRRTPIKMPSLAAKPEHKRQLNRSADCRLSRVVTVRRACARRHRVGSDGGGGNEGGRTASNAQAHAHARNQSQLARGVDFGGAQWLDHHSREEIGAESLARSAELHHCVRRGMPEDTVTAGRRRTSLPSDALLQSLIERMHRQVRIVLYPHLPGTPLPPRPRSTANRGYGVESAWLDRLREWPQRTEVASAGPSMCPSHGPPRCLFYVPFSGMGCRKALWRSISRHDRSMAPCVAMMANVTRTLQGGAKELLARRNGSDHFWVSAHDAGKGLGANADHRLLANGHCVANSAEASAADKQEATQFEPTRDVASVPCVAPLPSDTPPPSTERPTLAFFAGTLRDGVRTRLADGIAAWRQGSAALAARPIQWLSSSMGKEGYWRALRESVFCLCPAGHTVWSPRLIEAILAGCIPVVLADRYVLPLGCFADWSTFAVLVPEAEATSVPQRLAAFSSAAIDAMQGSLLRVRRYFAYASPSMAASRAPIIDAFTLGMLELWLKTRESPPEID